LICDLYGGDVSQWEQVNPLKEAKLEGLFERIIEHRSEDLELLELIVCSVGPAPVRMLAEDLGADEVEIRKKLAELTRWQMVEFEADVAGQHTVVRKFLTERMGQGKARENQKAIAAWWVDQGVPARPDKIEQIRPLLRAVEHLLAARDPDAAMDVFLMKPSPESYYTIDGWLQAFGYLDEDIRINTEAIRMCIEAIDKEDRRELRNNLASCYNNRGIAFTYRGKLSEAIVDYGRAIEIREELVDKERGRDLLNNLAMCYNNRGNAFSDQVELSEAIVDYGRAIEIFEELVVKECGRELRNHLATCYNNRGTAFSDQGKLPEAIDNFGRAIEVYEELLDKEDWHELRNDLAMCYNNRGNAFQIQGKLSEAIADYGLAIEIREQLVEKEGRRELRSDLEGSLFNRAVARTKRKEWKEAGADIDKGDCMLRELIEEGQRHVIRKFLETAGFRCAYAGRFGDIAKAAKWGNDAMRWFVEEVRASRTNEMLLKAAGKFSGRVEGNLEVLLKNGLDKELWETFRWTLKDAS